MLSEAGICSGRMKTLKIGYGLFQYTQEKVQLIFRLNNTLPKGLMRVV